MLSPKTPRMGLPKEGDDARSVGKADQNESVTAKERSGEPLTEEMSSGPKKGETGNLLPARYTLPSGNICEDR